MELLRSCCTAALPGTKNSRIAVIVPHRPSVRSAIKTVSKAAHIANSKSRAKELNVLNDGDRMHLNTNTKERIVAENVYKVIELIGTSTESWEKAAAAAVTRASKTLRDLRVAEVCELDLQLKNGKVEAYRAKVKVSFKYEKE
jgi:flavin-binding protein dodecin